MFIAWIAMAQKMAKRVDEEYIVTYSWILEIQYSRRIRFVNKAAPMPKRQMPFQPKAQNHD